MRKVMFGLCTLMICFFVAACGGNSSKADNDENEEKECKDTKTLIKELKNAKNWDEARFVEFFYDILDANKSFLETNPSAEEINDFYNLAQELINALIDLGDEHKEALNKALDTISKDEDYQKKGKEIGALWEEVSKKMSSAEYDLGDKNDVTQILSQLQQRNTHFEFSSEEEQMMVNCEMILNNIEDVWAKVFKDNGWGEYRMPTLVFFTDGVQSGCGSATSSVGPFYCRADEKLYIDLSFFLDMKKQLGVEGKTFAYAYVIAHEIGHHVEYLRGILTKDWSSLGESQNQISVRTELLADYYAGVWAHYENEMYNSLEDGDIERAIELAQKIGDDWLQKQAQGRAVEESFTHGTSKQRMYWLKKGLETGDMQTTTFSVPYHQL